MGDAILWWDSIYTESISSLFIYTYFYVYLWVLHEYLIKEWFIHC